MRVSGARVNDIKRSLHGKCRKFGGSHLIHSATDSNLGAIIEYVSTGDNSLSSRQTHVAVTYSTCTPTLSEQKCRLAVDESVQYICLTFSRLLRATNY